MTKPKPRAEEDAARTKLHEPKPTSEEDLQTKDASEMPLEPQDPVKPPDPAS
jgi:hypothetical protein